MPVFWRSAANPRAGRVAHRGPGLWPNSRLTAGGLRRDTSGDDGCKRSSNPGSIAFVDCFIMGMLGESLGYAARGCANGRNDILK